MQLGSAQEQHREEPASATGKLVKTEDIAQCGSSVMLPPPKLACSLAAHRNSTEKNLQVQHQDRIFQQACIVAKLAERFQASCRQK
jgi:hypothetical protein